MTNSEVIKCYFSGLNGKSHNGNLYISENKLINYSTPIVECINGIYHINTQKYSRTTSKIQSEIKNYVYNNDILNVIFM